MGGYGAILHGFTLKAFAIYAHILQLKLSGTMYADGINHKYYGHLLSDPDDIHMDLAKVIVGKPVSKSPVLFLSQNTIDRPNYVRQHFYLLSKYVIKRDLLIV
ncbi:hypothetical protein H0S58_13010 [Acinetobacter sp. TTH0-4]|uniref:hypothetical protein n=1 Tax=Acinetobacter sp. TTH0-4 TaxID=1646498 RepID=UPI00189F7CE9|nr:hypothetical protein [Acinetobacter sp. TTH0-4]QPF37854.1 hypothetical protein H0S58_13010 [Acinetobacter sp. TTH0-4]